MLYLNEIKYIWKWDLVQSYMYNMDILLDYQVFPLLSY